MTRILAIEGSYRDGGIIDQAVEAAVEGALEAGAEVEVIRLREHPIGFCLNCRECTQQPGVAPGICVQDDVMRGLVAKIEAADGYILAAPTNFYTVTALFKRFMERLLVYAYWPWDMDSPQLRKRGQPPKPAMLIASSAAPAIMARLLYTTHKQLRITANTIGAKPIGTLGIGLIAKQPQPVLPENARRKAYRMGVKLGR
jgi:multimeric flavodoxin WrbA